jgi:hypothetical protein
MGSPGFFQHNLGTVNISGGTFTDVRGDLNNHYHIHRFIDHEPELGRGEPLCFRVNRQH